MYIVCVTETLQYHVLFYNWLYSFALSCFPSGDYDALNVTMLLPRLVFKADLIIDQLKQQVIRVH